MGYTHVPATLDEDSEVENLIAIVAFIAGLATTAVAGDVYVNGYTRSDGTYVPGHYRSAPDSSVNNNWSTSPNVNPYTGERGTRSPTFTVPAPPRPAPMAPPSSGFGGGGSPPTFNPYNPYNRR